MPNVEHVAQLVVCDHQWSRVVIVFNGGIDWLYALVDLSGVVVLGDSSLWFGDSGGRWGRA